MSGRTVHHRLLQAVRGLTLSQAGNAAVELALILPVAAVVLSGVADYGVMVRTSNALQTAARAGAAYAAQYPSDAAGITQAAGSAAALDPATLTIAATQFCGCSNGSTVACGAPCADGGPTNVHVSVSVAQPYRPLTPFGGFVLPTTLTAQATLRTQ